MSDHPRVQQRHLRELKICDDVWLGVFEFLAPVRLAFKMALISERFDQLVHLHIKNRKWALGVLEVRPLTKGIGAQIVKYGNGRSKQLAIPRQPPPDNLIAFQRLTIAYIDRSVVAFLRRIRRLFNTDITLHLNILRNQNQAWNILAQQLCPLIVPKAMASPVGEMSDDRQEASVDQMLSTWLHIPRQDGRPKVLEYRQLRKPAVIRKLLEELKETFSDASSPVKYIVVMHLHFAVEPFDLENERTRERLTIQFFGDDVYLIGRGPVEREEHRWDEWEREAVAGNWKSVIQIAFGDEDIGPLQSSAAGPSRSSQ
uniref:F-box domain-containing protein n=1 Tax=Globodera pallida TaxID=36090 RepID=A0A183BJJ5_GLOPA